MRKNHQRKYYIFTVEREEQTVLSVVCSQDKPKSHNGTPKDSRNKRPKLINRVVFPFDVYEGQWFTNFSADYCLQLFALLLEMAHSDTQDWYWSYIDQTSEIN